MSTDFERNIMAATESALSAAEGTPPLARFTPPPTPSPPAPATPTPGTAYAYSPAASARVAPPTPPVFTV